MLTEEEALGLGAYPQPYSIWWLLSELVISRPFSPTA